jgi:hypothetical protein
MALIRGGSVRPHVQAFADAVSQATGADSFGTYPGHEPSIDLAVDCFVPTTSRVLGDAICDFALSHMERFGIWYVIYRQRIFNPSVAPYWRDMEDRGSPTQNHMDHVHLSFNDSAPPQPDQPPTRKDDLMLSFRYIFNGVDWVFDGPSRLYFQCDDPDQITQVLDRINVPALGRVSAATHRRYYDLALAAGFTG